MSIDLIFGFTKKDWSRTPPTIVHECGPEVCTISQKKEPLTEEEKVRLDRLAQVKMKAESGDKQAQRQWKKISSKMISLKAKAKKGDPKAKHSLGILEDSGLFGHVQKISGEESEGQGRRQMEELTRKGNIKDILKLKRINQEEALEVHGADPDELEAARHGGASERSAMARLQGIVISDKEIKDNMQGKISLLEGQGSYPRHRRRHHHRRRGMYQQPGQAPGQPYQGASTYVASRDSQKSQIVRSLYSQIKREHINWMTNQDLQNGITNQTTDKYQQAARAWARDQLQQQQLPTRYTASGTNQWQQPLSWFQTQAQAVLNNSSGQRATQINAAAAPATAPYSPAYPYTAAPPPAPVSSSPTNVYYPSSSSSPSYPSQDAASTDDPSLYDDDQQGWPSPLLMHGAFVGDEARAEGENSTSCGNGLPHSEYRALIMNQAIKEAGTNKPATKHLFLAKSKVDRALGASGQSIYIPGAKPCRRTV